MGNAFASRKVNQGICYSSRFQLDNFCSEFLSKSNILLKRGVVLGLNSAHLFIWRFNVDSIPVTGEATSDARSDAKQLLRATTRGHGYHHLLRNDCLFKSFALAIVVCLSGLVCGYLPQGELA